MGLLSIRTREVLCKRRDVARCRAPPSIDRLEGIANSRDRMATALSRGTTGEQATQHDRLRCRGVLVLIEQYDTECGSHRAGDLRDLGGKPGRNGHLVGELHQSEPLLQRLIVAYQTRQLETLLTGDDRLLDVGVGIATVVARRRGEPSSRSRACPSRSLTSTRCCWRSASSRSTRSVTVAGRSREMNSNGPAAAFTTRDASRYRVAPLIKVGSASKPSRSPCSATSRAANASYVMINCSPDSSTPRSAITPARSSALRTRWESSAAALRVNVSPSTSSGRTVPVPTSQTTRAAITVVLPDPAPAMITPGSSGAVMAFSCWVEKEIPSASISAAALSSRVLRRGRHEGVNGHLTTCCPAGCAGQLVRKGQ